MTKNQLQVFIQRLTKRTKRTTEGGKNEIRIKTNKKVSTTQISIETKISLF